MGNWSTVKEIVNQRSQIYKKLKPDLNALTEDQVINMIISNPNIMVRPILTDQERLLVGFKEDKYQEFFQL